MKLLQLNHDDERGARLLKGTYANASHFDHVVDDDTIALTPDGEVLAVLVTAVLSSRARRKADKHLSTIYGMPSNRATAVYRGSSLPRIRKRDSSLSRTRQVPHSILDLLKSKGVRADVLGSYLDHAPPSNPPHLGRHKNGQRWPVKPTIHPEWNLPLIMS